MRPKPFLTYFLLCAIPLFLLAGLNYWNGTRAVDSTVSAITQNDLNAFSAGVDELLDENQKSILQFAIAPATRNVIIRTDSGTPFRISELTEPLPELGKSIHQLTLYNSTKTALWTLNNGEWVFCLLSSTGGLPQPDEHVWTQQGNVSFEQLQSSPASLKLSVPIHDEKGTSVLGAAVAVLDLASVFSDAARGLQTKSNQNSMVIVMDRSGNTLYQSNRSMELSQVLSGTNYQVAYAPLPRLNATVAIARNSSTIPSNAGKWGITGFVLALLAALVGAFVLERHVRSRSKGIARVTEDVSAIAKGELDRRIILQSSDDARGLADNINVVTERLRVQIAREEETRQFESFMRVSAMLTHDLKNAIEGLSLTVGNMERHFDNPQFRADA